METKTELVKISNHIKTPNSFKNQLSQKRVKISDLIQDYLENVSLGNASLPPIIEELKQWLNEDNSEINLAKLLIRNYLAPTQDSASLLMKIALPDIFNKQELEKVFKENYFSQEEKENFENVYLKNLIESKNSISSISTFFSNESQVEIQKMIFSKRSSYDLIQSMTTNKLTNAISVEILFERDDEQAISYQTKTLENWFAQIENGEYPLSQILSCEEDLNSWIHRIKKGLTNSERPLTYKIHCIKLLQYLCGIQCEDMKSSLNSTISKIHSLDVPQIEDDEFFNKALKKIHEFQKTSVLKAVTSGTKLSESFDLLLDKIEKNKDKNATKLEDIYQSLSVKSDDLSELQLIRAIPLLYSKASEAYIYSPNHAEKTLFDIIKKTPTLPLSIQKMFLQVLKENTHVGCQGKDFKDYLSFHILLQFADSKHPEILPELTEVLIARLSDEIGFVQSSVHSWIPLIAPRLTKIPDNLISGLIKILKNGDWQRKEDTSLQALSGQLSNSQLAQYIYQHLPCLTENKKSLIINCRIISALASSISPCPADIVLLLISLVELDDKAVSWEALNTLQNLQPNFLLFPSNTINKLLQNEAHNKSAFKSIIKYSKSLTSFEVNDGLIHSLIHSNGYDYCDREKFELKTKALNLLSQHFSDSQLTAYVESCMHENDYDFTGASKLCAIPIDLLNGRLKPIFTKLSNSFKDESWFVRDRACQALKNFEKLLHLSPENFIFDFICMLDDKDYRVQSKVCKALPKILPFIKAAEVEKTFEFLLSNITSKKDIISEKRRTVCKSLSLLASSLDQAKVRVAKDALIIALDDKDWKTELAAFKSLTKIAYRFSGKELESLLIILANKSDQHTLKYLREILHLIKGDAQLTLVNVLFTTLSTNPVQACLTLSLMAPNLNPELVSKIISKFIAILEFQGSNHEDRRAALNGLIKLADLMSKEDINQLSSLPETSFELISGKYIIKSLVEIREIALSKEILTCTSPF
ncbi:MAG: hypothetical protein H0U57_13055 [Tatlockia sp.]|nr:hypothetical protein [Tatlockia sp.]